ncbi:glycosyltransferase family 2 protein [Chiayiivirga flava]|uniref:glycosyltransferase family 2 protein n=1 Tax=Chiayiivirga flava TaxID=659595 RepID=UPI001FE5CE28|nr:glycosyltransferase family 2 protein [Chiayiivirga flava]
MRLSLVVPVYFEQECIARFIAECRAVLDPLGIEYEMVFCDDGSSDRTTAIIREHALSDLRIRLIELSYNHGKQAAVSAAIAHASGELLLYMDPDLQDPPEEIPRFLAAIGNDYDLVFGVRSEKKDRLLNRVFSRLFWATLEKFTGLEIPRGLAVMRIFNRRFADQFLRYAEQNRFIEGIFMHIGMRRGVIEIAQRARFAGVSKFNFRRKMALAFDAILDFSELPLTLAVKLGAWISALALAAVLTVVALKLALVDFQAGWPSLLSLLLLGFGVQLFFLGVAALYVGRIYREVKGRPLFSIRALVNLSPPDPPRGG